MAVCLVSESALAGSTNVAEVGAGRSLCISADVEKGLEMLASAKAALRCALVGTET